MADATGSGKPRSIDEERAKAAAAKLVGGGTESSEAAQDEDTARIMARRVLEDSDARTHDPATVDPENDDVIRRGSEESAATGDD
ncbi:MAG: hypothetical protein H0U53_09000 [Actinobacteria bacterium]|nr:hypothetical protein [Actinomycetota bacterium]